MSTTKEAKRPTSEEQKVAMEAYDRLIESLKHIHSEYPEIELEETKERIKLPLKTLRLLSVILKEIARGNPVTVIPVATELTTQSAAELLGCSRPHLIKLLERGEMAYTKIGRHRRIKYQDVMAYKTKLKKEQRRLLIEMMKADEEDGLYDS